MFRAGTVLTRTVAFLAVGLYALLPGVTLAQCACLECVCVAADDQSGCCCSGAVQTPACCLPADDACSHCGSPVQAAHTADCQCEQLFDAHEPVPQTQRAETTEQHAQAAPAADVAAVVFEPQTAAAVDLAVWDPAAHAPPIHLMNCVWRN